MFGLSGIQPYQCRRPAVSFGMPPQQNGDAAACTINARHHTLSS